MVDKPVIGSIVFGPQKAVPQEQSGSPPIHGELNSVNNSPTPAGAAPIVEKTCGNCQYRGALIETRNDEAVQQRSYFLLPLVKTIPHMY